MPGDDLAVEGSLLVLPPNKPYISRDGDGVPRFKRPAGLMTHRCRNHSLPAGHSQGLPGKRRSDPQHVRACGIEVRPAASSIDREGFWTCCCPCFASSKRSPKKMPAHLLPMVCNDFSGCSARSLMLNFLRARDRTSGNCSSGTAFSSAHVWEKATRPPVSFFMKRGGAGQDG